MITLYILIDAGYSAIIIITIRTGRRVYMFSLATPESSMFYILSRSNLQYQIVEAAHF